MPKGFEMNWRGPEVQKKMQNACRSALNTIAATCVRWAKVESNHGGWVNITGRASGSVQVIQPATLGNLYVQWGSRGVEYFRRLEFEHGAVLRTSAAQNYDDLDDEIRRRFAS